MARVHWGRWIADCPRPGCPGAEHYGPHEVTGHIGGLTLDRFTCAFCKLTCLPDWPADTDSIGLILGQRPVPSTRNWLPGETLGSLLAENVLHGIAPTPDVAAAVAFEIGVR